MAINSLENAFLNIHSSTESKDIANLWNNCKLDSALGTTNDSIKVGR